MLRRINISAAVIVLICFFLPWVQVSCAGARDTLSGFDLARHDDALLWLIPVLMLLTIAFGLLKGWTERPTIAATISLICGVVTALLMNRQRIRVSDDSAVISAQLTGWFWLALISSVALMLTGLTALFRRRRS